MSANETSSKYKQNAGYIDALDGASLFLQFRRPSIRRFILFACKGM
jgi:hypothetical protein